MKTWDIRAIEKITEEEAKAMCIESMVIKEHNIYFVDFGGYFKYSVLVFKNNHHIFHANDYELHHAGKTKEELKTWYVQAMNNVLFTDKEIAEPLTDYDEYTRKVDYLGNCYSQREDYISIFWVGSTAKRRSDFKKQTENMFYDELSFAYYYNEEFIKRHYELRMQLEEQKEKMKNNFEYLKNAFLKEMFNHEYCYSWQGNYDVLSCFGRIKYVDSDILENYFEQLHFTDEQKRAFYAARKEYYKQIGDDY